MRDFMYFVFGAVWMPVYMSADTITKNVACWFFMLIIALYSIFRTRNGS